MTTPAPHERTVMPAILYGTAWKKEQTAQFVSTAIRAGFRGIDTACQPKHYHEKGVGEGIAACLADGITRRELFLQTKFTSLSGQDPANVPYDPRASLSEQVVQSVGRSLVNLQTDYLDSLVLHSPLPEFSQTLEAWRAMESCCDSHRVHQLGISNCYDLKALRHLHEQARVVPKVVQNRFYADSGYDREIRAFCRDNGIVYQSFWTLTANPHLLASRAVMAAASRTARTPQQVLFRYLSHEDVVPLTGTRSLVHMQEDLAIRDFQLSQNERDAITALL